MTRRGQTLLVLLSSYLTLMKHRLLSSFSNRIITNSPLPPVLHITWVETDISPSSHIQLWSESLAYLFGAVGEDVVQLGHELERVEGHDAVVVVGREEQRGRVLDTVGGRHAHVVQRREAGQVLKVFLLVRTAVVRHPAVTDRELVEAQHVHDPGRREDQKMKTPFRHSLLCHGDQYRIRSRIFHRKVVGH